MSRVAAVALVLSILPALASAESLRLLNTTVLEARGDNDNAIVGDDDYGVGINKLYLTGQTDNTAVNVQVDTVIFTNHPDVSRPTPSNPSAYASEARLERISLVHSIGDSTLALGDSHLQLGRGLALSLRKVDELGTDQALRGGVAAWQADFASARFFAGRTNIANLDGVTQRFLEDPDDTLAGASATLHFGRADVSFHGLYLQPSVATLPEVGEDQTVLGGAYVDLPLTDWLSLYAEGAVEQYRIAKTDQTGAAAYAAADLDLQFASLLLEGLWLDRFQVAGSYDNTLHRRNVYNQPPTLERFDQEVLDNENVSGGRAKVSRAFLEGGLVLYVSGMYRQYGPSTALIDAVHGYGGFEFTYGGGGSRWYASAGYREEIQEGDPFKTMVHGETDWVQALNSTYSFHLTVAHESRTLLQRDYIRGTTLIGFDRAHTGSLLAEIGYDTFNAQTQQAFLAGIVAWNATDWLILKGVVGSQRGGIKCIGGVCRDFPAFSGGRLEATLHYDLM